MWIAALAVGCLVWGLTIWCMVRYRRRKDDVGLPPQLRYNVPIEILYTVIPVMMVGVIFYFTARDAAILLDTSAEEIYPCLTRGATLVLRDGAMASSPDGFVRELERLGITILDLPTAYWHELVA